MELAILLGVGLVGYYLNQNDGNKIVNDTTNVRIKPMPSIAKKINRNEQNNNLENVYDIDDLDDIYSDSARKRLAKKISTRRDYSFLHTSDEENGKDLLDVSEKLTDNSNSIGKILDSSSQQQPSYLSQFDVQTFDSEGPPSAPNDIYQTGDKTKLSDLERKLSYQGGWSQYDNKTSMSYGILPDDQLTHDNMVPFFKTKYGYGSNDLQNEHVMNYKNQLFTGNLRDTWNNKQEVQPHFKPEADLSHPYGTPVRSEEELTRYIPSRYRQNEKLFDEVRVTPGVNLDYNEVGTHGFHSMYRVLNKTVDELRVKPKITYEGRVIDGMHGEKRPIQAPVITYKPDTYKTTTEADLLPTDNVVDGPKTRDNFIMKDTDRAKQHFEYTGGAYTTDQAVGRNVPEHMRGAHKYSTKPTFTLPKPLQKFSRVETKFNPNTKSYNLPSTAREQTCHTKHNGIAGNVPGSSMYTNHMDIAKPTIKETTASIPQQHTHVAPNTMRGTTQPMDIANPTIKETTIENRLNPNVGISDTQQRVYYSDHAKATTKESTLQPVVPMNVMHDQNMYANWTDPAKQTTKQTTVQIPYQTTITPVNQQQQAPHPQDIAKPTTKESTVYIPYQTTLTPINQQQQAPHPQDVARHTIKQTTVDIPYQTNITPVNQAQRAPHPQDIAKQTIKEHTVQTPWNNFATPVNQQQHAPHPQDIAKHTIKEHTVQTPWNNFVTPVNQHQQAPHPQDIARPTIKQSTVEIPYQTNITPIDQAQRAPHPQDIAKETTKQTTVQIPYQTMVMPVNMTRHTAHHQDNARPTIKETTMCIPYNTILTAISQGKIKVRPQDYAKPTIKETTVEIPHNTHLTAVNQAQRAPHPQDNARPTIKQSTVQIPYNNYITAVDRYQGQAATFDRTPLRPTTKQGTVEIPYNTNVSPINQNGPSAYPQDDARATIKETTVETPYNTHVIAVNQGQRAPHPQDIARSTIKQTTVQTPHNTHTTAVSQVQSQASAFNRTPLRETVKETTIENNYVTGPTNNVHGRGFGYMAENMYAPNTNKQFTCQEVYIAPAEGDAKSRPYDDAYNARIDDRKDTLHWYRPPTTCGVNIGPDVDQVNVSLRDPNHQAHMPAPGFTINNTLDRMQPQLHYKYQNNVPNDRFIDPMLLKQLETNELNIPRNIN